jgi:hypothetical protein
MVTSVRSDGKFEDDPNQSMAQRTVAAARLVRPVWRKIIVTFYPPAGSAPRQDIDGRRGLYS